MDPATVAATAIAAALPYVAALAKQTAKSTAEAAGKSVWEWVKGMLTSETGKEVIKDLESGPTDDANRMAVEAALVKHLKSNPGTLSELAQLLDKAGTMSATISAVVKGHQNKTGQVVGSGSVSIS